LAKRIHVRNSSLKPVDRSDRRGRSSVRVTQGLSVVGLTAAGLAGLGAPAFAQDAGDPVAPLSDQIQSVGHPVYFAIAQAGPALRGAAMSAGVLDPLGSFTAPGL
jgi:hypothetical protein